MLLALSFPTPPEQAAPLTLAGTYIQDLQAFALHLYNSALDSLWRAISVVPVLSNCNF